MVDITVDDLKDIRERLDEQDIKIAELNQVIALLLGNQIHGNDKTKFFKIFFDRE